MPRLLRVSLQCRFLTHPLADACLLRVSLQCHLCAERRTASSRSFVQRATWATRSLPSARTTLSARGRVRPAIRVAKAPSHRPSVRLVPSAESVILRRLTALRARGGTRPASHATRCARRVPRASGTRPPFELRALPPQISAAAEPPCLNRRWQVPLRNGHAMRSGLLQPTRQRE